MSYDRASELKAFDETKTGVKGLLDAGITTIPRFFHSTADGTAAEADTGFSIPIGDLQGPRERVVSDVKYVSETFGFFQVVNHGVPVEAIAEMREGVRRFMEDDDKEKVKYYTRDKRKVVFHCNLDLFSAPAANWRHTLFCVMASDPPLEDDLPVACR